MNHFREDSAFPRFFSTSIVLGSLHATGQPPSQARRPGYSTGSGGVRGCFPFKLGSFPRWPLPLAGFPPSAFLLSFTFVVLSPALQAPVQLRHSLCCLLNLHIHLWSI